MYEHQGQGVFLSSSADICDPGSSDANQAVQLSLVQPGPTASKELVTFHPAFTYPIFGDEETIFGYQELNINIRFAAHDLHSNVQISWDKKFKTIGETKATDIKETLSPYLPESKQSFALHELNWTHAMM